MQITIATPRTRELYFAGLIFVVCKSTAKTAKIGPLENFPLYGNEYPCQIKVQLTVWSETNKWLQFDNSYYRAIDDVAISLLLHAWVVIASSTARAKKRRSAWYTLRMRLISPRCGDSGLFSDSSALRDIRVRTRFRI